MARLPLRKRKSRLDTVKDLAQIYTTLKLSQAGPRAARRAAKGYAGVKAAKAGGRGARRVLGIVLAPVAIGGLVAFLKKRNQEPPGYQPVSSPPVPSTSSEPPSFERPAPAASDATPADDTTPAMGEAAAPKSGTTSASPDEPADAPAGDGAERS